MAWRSLLLVLCLCLVHFVWLGSDPENASLIERGIDRDWFRDMCLGSALRGWKTILTDASSQHVGMSTGLTLSRTGDHSNAEKALQTPVPQDDTKKNFECMHILRHLETISLTMNFLLFIAAMSLFLTPGLSRHGNVLDTVSVPHRCVTPPHCWPHKKAAPQLPYADQQPVIPKVQSAKIIGMVSDPSLDRDSCGSVAFGDRVLWTCRDTQLFYPNGSVQITPLITSTASWTNYRDDGHPDLIDLPPNADPLVTTVLEQYGNNSLSVAYFPVTDAFCGNPSGSCADDTRYALWPDLPPMITQSNRHSITAYTWIRQSHIRQDLSEVETNPATTLYKVTYSPKSYNAQTSLPQVSIVSQFFWPAGQISFGNYGNVVRSGVAYLYGQAEGITALAKVVVEKVEDKSAYQYWVNGTWTSTIPKLGQDGINITNANAGGQGTYYFSEPWHSYVWIGGKQEIGSDMYITTSPNPEGPWIEPVKFFKGVDGNYSLGAYSVQAHPGLIRDPNRNEMYVTYTKNDLDRECVNVYSSPLVHVVWE